jgi:DNA-3-methyladenine glycosylase II
MPRHIHTEADLTAALEKLVAADTRLAAVLGKAGRPPLRRREAGLAGLAAIIVSQQISVASASAIWARLAAAVDPFHHATLRRIRRERLVRAGLSTPKIRTLRAIAAAIDEGALDLEALAQCDAETAHAALTAVHGIGPWTADSYLLFCLGHADAWPAGDLALQEAARLAFGLRKRPTAKRMIELAERWRPYRAVAARLLWTYYRAVKHRDPVPVTPRTGNSPNGRRPRRPAP